jgi:hypothetical protein
MKRFFAFVLLSVVAMGAVAAPTTPPQVEQEVLLSCDTMSGKQLMVTRVALTDIITILYGEDLSKPEMVVAKKGNDMGTSYKYSAAEGTSNREIYAGEGQKFTTVGVTDDQGKRTAYFYVQEGANKTINTKCDMHTLKDKFSFDENFANLTYVD